MKKDIAYIGVILVLFLFIIRSNFDISLKKGEYLTIDSVKIDKVIPKSSNSFKVVNPKPTVINNYISNDKELKQIIKELEKKHNQKADSIIILRELLQARKVRKYTEVFEDSIITATVNSEVKGVLNSIDFSYTKKPQIVSFYDKTITEKIKPKFSLLLGGRIESSNNINNAVIGANINAQLKNGNIIELGYNTNKQISIGYKMNILRRY